MDHQDEREEKKALRASNTMRQSLGFYPTNKKSPAEWRIFKTLNGRAGDFLKRNKIFGGNARENLTRIAMFVMDESKELWSFVRQDRQREEDLKELLPNRDACDAYVYATVFSCMGGYDKYSNDLKKSKEEGGGGGGMVQGEKRARRD